jgi:chromate transporter
MTAQKPTFSEALQFWFKLGWISFGGPAGQIAIMHQYLVDQKKWISESRFLHALNYCMLLPGPEAQQLAVYIGWLLHGTRGGLVAGLLFVLPSMFILLALSAVYVIFGNLPWVYALFAGLKPAVIAIVILALIKIGKKSLHTVFHYVIAAAAFVSIFFFNIPFPYIILVTLVLALLAQRFFPQIFQSSVEKQKTQKADDESQYYINRDFQLADSGFRFSRLARQVAVFVLLWVLPFGLFYAFSPDFGFWRQLTVFFSQAAFVTFGGAYAVLPYVAQVSVEKLHWLSQLEMIDGLALGETTPGPLIMVLAFVGFMAGYHQFGNSLAMASLGLVTTTYYTFLPCFFFIFAGAPIIEQTQQNPRIRQLLGFVTAAVVGVVLNLTIYLAKAVIIPTGTLAQANYWALAWVIISVVALHRFKANMIAWIGVSAMAGLVGYFVQR